MMNRGFRIGQIFGINIHLDWSWAIIFLLITWSLAAGVFPAWHPDWQPALSWGVAVAAAILFFISILLHELSHSLVAKARGLPVKRITLFLFGGVSNIEREPDTPKTEFLMAVVGPLTSILLGIIFLALASVSVVGLDNAMANPQQVIAQLDPLTTLWFWLGPINIALGIFNMIPGFPLDGGRILRAVLWQATGSLRKATRWASGVGQFTAWTFILAGLAMIFGTRIPFLGTGIGNGIWLILIGWFLNNAALSSYQQVVVRDLLEDIPVARLMRSEVAVVPPGLTVSELVYNWVMGTDERAFPVMDEGQMIGLVCLEDVRRVPREQWDTVTVSEIMTRVNQLDTVSVNEDASEAFDKLTRRDVRQVPVVSEGRLVGLLRRRDIVKWLQLQSEFGLPRQSH
jgi:Zn-dependent protease/CBS domain-containing protein